MGLEKHFPKPKDLNDISPKSFCDLVMEFVTVRLGLKRIILVGHSFGAILAQAITYSHPDVIAGCAYFANSQIAPHLGFLAYTNLR